MSAAPAGGDGQPTRVHTIGFPRAAGATASVIGLAALAGWQLHIPRLTSPAPDDQRRKSDHFHKRATRANNRFAGQRGD